MSMLYRCDVCDEPAVAQFVADDADGSAFLSLHVCEQHLRGRAHKATDDLIAHMLDAQSGSGTWRIWRVRDQLPLEPAR